MQITKNVSLKSLNTLGLDVKAKVLLEIDSLDDLQDAIKTPEVQNSRLLVLGGGSNILLTDNFDGVVLKNNIKGIDVIHETEEFVVVKVGAGENWHQFVLYALQQNWGGIENLSLIPGTIGAAPMQNIGAYGVELKEVFEYLLAVNITTGEVKKFNYKQCDFGYRESVFKNIYHNKYVIAEVVLKLSKKDHDINISYGAIQDTLKDMNINKPSIQDVSKAVIKIRQSKLPDPKEIGNAGSFFKNPTIDKLNYDKLKIDFPDIPGYKLPDDMIKVPAGWLIEKAGWKGHTRGEIGVHKKQALVLVNYGDGSGVEIKQLAKEIQKSVIEKFGIELTTEVNMI